jgi:excisionase family DNA binding protein
MVLLVVFHLPITLDSPKHLRYNTDTRGRAWLGEKDTDRAKTMKKALSTLDISRMLGVAVASVAKWIDQNQLNAGKTPGGHRRVQVEDLLAFLHRQNLPVPAELLSSQRRILIVDDEKAVSAWVADEVKTEFPDCEVYQANDGFAAANWSPRSSLWWSSWI